MYQEQIFSLIPHYADGLSRQLGVLQHLQTLLNNHATLSDVAELVQSFQQEFGVYEQLERVIQLLASRCLEQQLIQRKNRSFCIVDHKDCSGSGFTEGPFEKWEKEQEHNTTRLWSKH